MVSSYMRVGKCSWFRLLSPEICGSLRLLSWAEVPITLHTLPTFTGCFPARCRPSQPGYVQKSDFFPLARLPAPHVTHQNAFFLLETPPTFAPISPNEPKALEPVSPGDPASRHISPPRRSQECCCCVLLRPLLPPCFT